MKMKYCKRCLQPDTRPGVVFDDEQICFACRYEESKATIDWAAREAELKGFAEENCIEFWNYSDYEPILSDLRYFYDPIH